MTEVSVNKLKISNSNPFTLIAGLNVLESDKVIEQVITHCIAVTQKLSIPYIFKASYDKANRSSVDSYRGPGVDEGLNILSDLKKEFKVPIISDVHNIEEVSKASEVLDVIQIPAFLSRQTDLIREAASSNIPLNIKKGQFMAPEDTNNIINKCEHFGNNQIMICERGSSFGYNNLVVDMLGMTQLKESSYPIIFDVTHSLQRPGGLGDRTDGRGSKALDLARSGMALGLAGLFLETHPDPKNALCDGPCALKIDLLEDFLVQIKAIDDLVKSFL
tara:strand:- start:11302 stop:12126 length:825 start_codon:yes stop_codon:yes gene_type:complete